MFTELTKGQVFRYALLPEVLPRMKNLIASGFGNLAYFMALVYRAVNILPQNHPYLQVGAAGKYTVRNVLSEAANNLVFSPKHIDQIIIFFALIAGIVILVIQFFLLLMALLVNPAAAQTNMPANYGEFFVTGNRSEDLALRLLDAVFGIPDLFGSKEATETSFHTALHGLFQLYSVGLLVIAVMIIIYFIFAILAETAQTGTPFGKRYNHVWAPIRLVVALGLLIPISYGMNSGQWITLYAAKFGSGFATNGWIKFNETIRDNYIPSKDLVAKPHIPALKNIAGFMMLAQGCKKAYQVKFPPNEEGSFGDRIGLWLVKDIDGGSAKNMEGIGYQSAVEYFKGGDIHIRIGVKSDEYTDFQSKVYPHCGDIILQNTEPVKANETGDYSLSSSQLINARYYLLVKEMWQTDFQDMKTKAQEFVEVRLTHKKADPLPQELRTTILGAAKKYITDYLDAAIEQARREFKNDETYKKYGWGGAGMWYNQIANVNGRITTAAMNIPQIKNYPAVMHYTCEKNQQQNNQTSQTECYNPFIAGGKKITYSSPPEEDVAAALSPLFDYWFKDPEGLTGNAFIDTINVILGTQGLFDMCENADIHPLAQLSSLGKGLVEAAIRNLGFSLGFGLGSILVPYFGPALGAASSFFGTVASIGILIGFILYYLIPFMPFLYFFFAVGGWVKGLFEAMVGVPLWALAHLRIDGEGLPGDAAANGYFLVFEIFIRPILIVFGLLASILIFGAMVKILNDTFSLIVSNLSGFGSENAPKCSGGAGSSAPTGSLEYFRGPVDEFFFTIVYAIMVYMIGMSSFKLIDLIPNSILRWMGSGVQTYNDQAGEPAEGLISKMAIGGSMMSQQLQIAGNLKQAGQQAKEGVKDMMKPKDK